jgi:hypothetical protein
MAQTASMKRASASSKLMTFQIAERYCTNKLVGSCAGRERYRQETYVGFDVFVLARQNLLVRVFEARK